MTDRGRRAGSSAWDLQAFVGALAQQLDQTMDDLRVKSLSRPMTFGVRDVELDLKVFPQYDDAGGLVFRNAQADEQNASELRLQLSTITRPVIDQSTRDLGTDDDPRSLDQVDLPAEARRNLGRMGVSTIGDLKRIGRSPTATSEIAQRARIGVEDLARIIHETRRPQIRTVAPVGGGPPPRIKLTGDHLDQLKHAELRIGGEPARVVDARPRSAEVELLARPRSPAVEITLAGQPPIAFAIPSRGGPR